MRAFITQSIRWLGVLSLGALLAACEPREQESQRGFRSPQEAVREMLELIGTRNEQAVERLFGPGSAELISSGDPYEDREDFDRVKAMIEARVAFADFDEHTKVALFGEQGWPFPIPLVRDEAGRWRFDLNEGREELLNRRIGHNELQTIAALHAVVEAQQEFASEPRDGRPPGYARQLRSIPGFHDGLYWTPRDGEDTSPRPYHGYLYRVLDRQGPSAPGGAQSYLDAQGSMSRGFAVIAWPARYGNSGVMSFVVNQRGIVFQKDLGERTGDLAPSIGVFDPDASWNPALMPATEP